MKARAKIDQAEGSEPRARQSGIRPRVLHSDEQLAAMVVAREHASRTLHELSNALAEDLDYVTAIRHAARVLATRLAAACVIDIAGKDGVRIAHATSLVEPVLSTVLRPVSASVMASGSSLYPGERHADNAARQLGAQSLVVVPLAFRDAVFGTMTLVGDTSRPLAISVEEAETLARRMGAAIHNGRAYDAAVAEARMREEVMSIVSHDLKNPIGVISMCTARLLADPALRKADDAQRSMAMLQRSAASMKSLVVDLLDVAAIDGGAMKIRGAWCDAPSIVQEAIERMRPLALEAGVKLGAASFGSVPPIWADRERVLQVLSNLLGNAVKFTPAGGSVVVRLNAAGEMVTFTVADNGTGISPTDLRRVFDRFWQAKGGRRLGTGLGLAICRSLVELSGGTISAESEAGAGTAITFTMPCRAACEDALAACLSPA